MARIDKRALVASLRAQIAADIAAAARAAKDAAAAATHEEAKPENDKDTRGLEQSYLARGQAERVRDLERADNLLQFLPLRDAAADEQAALGAVVTLAPVDGDGEPARYFIAPAGGGLRVETGGVTVLVVTPEAPLGRALVGKCTGDTAVVRARGGAKEYEIVAVE